MPKMNESYGAFIALSAIAIFGFFEVVGRVVEVLSDIEGSCAIKQNLIMPLKAWQLFVYTASIWGLYSLLLSLPQILITKAVLGSNFALSTIHWPKFALALVIGNLFHGFFALWLVAVIRKMQHTASIYFRVVNPLFMFSAYFSSWGLVFEKAHWLGLLTLINPLVYLNEAVHAAALGQEGFLPYWNCVGMLCLFILVLGVVAIKKLKTRLDCV